MDIAKDKRKKHASHSFWYSLAVFRNHTNMIHGLHAEVDVTGWPSLPYLTPSRRPKEGLKKVKMWRSEPHSPRWCWGWGSDPDPPQAAWKWVFEMRWRANSLSSSCTWGGTEPQKHQQQKKASPDFLRVSLKMTYQFSQKLWICGFLGGGVKWLAPPHIFVGCGFLKACVAPMEKLPCIPSSKHLNRWMKKLNVFSGKMYAFVFAERLNLQLVGAVSRLVHAMALFEQLKKLFHRNARVGRTP